MSVTEYRRPDITMREFRDARGRVYGSHWGDSGPPESAYSVDTHPERFTPLHTIADALIVHLVSTCDVTVEDSLAVADDLLHPMADVTRAVRLTPASSDAAPLTFVFTPYPGVLLHAGLLHDFCFPVCGCDACDDTWDSLAEELEWHVIAVAGGRYVERYLPGLSPRVGYTLTALDDSASVGGEARSRDLPADRVVAARRRLRALRDGWRAWPTRR